MKRLDLVQLVIITAGLFAAYIFISAVPAIIVSLFSWANTGMSGGAAMEFFLGRLVMYGFYFFVALCCIKYSKQLGSWVCSKGNFSADVNIAIDKTSLLYILFVGLGLYGLIQIVPGLLVTAFNKIKSNNSFMPSDSGVFSTTDMVTKIITLLMYFSLVYYAGVFAEYFSSKIKNKEPEDEIADESPIA